MFCSQLIPWALKYNTSLFFYSREVNRRIKNFPSRELIFFFCACRDKRACNRNCNSDFTGFFFFAQDLQNHLTFHFLIDQLRHIKIQPDKIDLITKPHKLCSYSPEPRTEVYCFRLNFNISKLVYCITPFFFLSRSLCFDVFDA